GGPAMLAAARAAAGDVALLGVTVLTSHDAGDFERVVGRGVPDLGFEAERLARLALDAGLAGVVASGHELGLLRETLGPGPLIVVPGIRAPGDAAEDQARTISAVGAGRGGDGGRGAGLARRGGRAHASGVARPRRASHCRPKCWRRVPDPRRRSVRPRGAVAGGGAAAAPSARRRRAFAHRERGAGSGA